MYIQNYYIILDSIFSEIYSETWLQRIYFSCQRNLNEEKITRETSSNRDAITIDSLVENHEGLLWFWALWECAQFCVESKLRTPLGKALDTFVAFEGIKFILNKIFHFMENFQNSK